MRCAWIAQDPGTQHARQHAQGGVGGQGRRRLAVALAGLDVLILDCLRETPHPSHFSLSQALEAIAELAPRRAVLTNLHIDLDYENLSKRLPAGIAVAFDGMSLTVDG